MSHLNQKSNLPEITHNNKYGPLMADKNKSFTVAVRVKPILNDDPNKSVTVPRVIADASKSFTPHVLAPCASQEDLYNVVIPQLAQSYLNGKDCTLLAYGETGSGKTHSMFGPPGCLTEASLASVQGTGQLPSSWGLFPRTAFDILNTIQGPNKLSAWAVEVYMDRFYDLINMRKPVVIRGISNMTKSSVRRIDYSSAEYDKGKWVQPSYSKKETNSFDVTGQTETLFETMEDVAKFARLVETTRSTQEHSLNIRSSRSHCVICMSLVSSPGSDSKGRSTVQSSRFLFVDLAGSERVFKTGVVEDGRGREKVGLRFDEARNVNSSLTALGRCVSALAAKKSHVPFRDSALTMLLGQSLGGHSQTSVVINVYECVDEIEETKASLRFGSCLSVVRIKQKKVAEKSNDEHVDVLRARLQSQLDALKAEIKVLKDKGHGSGLDESFPRCTIDGFLQNKERLEKARTIIEKTKQDLLEAKAAGSDDAVHEAEERLVSAKHEEWVYEGLFLRQKSTGIYKPPSATMTKKINERKYIETQLKRIEQF